MRAAWAELEGFYLGHIGGYLTSPGLCFGPVPDCVSDQSRTVFRIDPGNRNFLILVFLTGIMDSRFFLIFQRNRFGFFLIYRWVFL